MICEDYDQKCTYDDYDANDVKLDRRQIGLSECVLNGIC